MCYGWDTQAIYCCIFVGYFTCGYSYKNLRLHAIYFFAVCAFLSRPTGTTLPAMALMAKKSDHNVMKEIQNIILHIYIYIKLPKMLQKRRSCICSIIYNLIRWGFTARCSVKGLFYCSFYTVKFMYSITWQVTALVFKMTNESSIMPIVLITSALHICIDPQEKVNSESDVFQLALNQCQYNHASCIARLISDILVSLNIHTYLFRILFANLH